MKRIFALLFALLMLTAQVCYAAPAQETAAAPEAQAQPAPEAVSAADHLSVGNPNPLRGEFFTDLWGNSTSDQDVRDLLHGYNLIYWDNTRGLYNYDPTVVADMKTEISAAGDKTYTFTLRNDLVYSDGSPVTAWDYAFSILLQIAPEMEALGATPARKPQFTGFQAYTDGAVPYLTGVRVTADNVISITLDHTYLPYFFEMALVSVQPYPISVIAPGVKVCDDGNGVYLANIDETITEPVFTAELLAETILDPATGYQSHPSVVSGPYVLTSWDGETAQFEINEKYKGNPYGQKPQIRTLSFSMADNAAMIEDLDAGKYDLLNKVMNKDAISAGMTLMKDPEADRAYSMSNYPRSGTSYISFACEKPALAEPAVRQAIAWCMDREQVMKDYVDFYGTLVNGYYGAGQWQYALISGTLLPPVTKPDSSDAKAAAEYEKTMEGYKSLSLDGLTDYEVDTDRAAGLLDRAGWELNAEGVREKTIAAGDAQDTPAQTITLDLKLAYAEGNPIAESFAVNFVPNLEKVGIKLELVPMNFTDLLDQFYDPQLREADMFFLATNFDVSFDASAAFVAVKDPQTGAEVHTWAATGCDDEELYRAAVAMRETQPGDVLTYCQKWISFQKRFNEVLPMLPIYSNVYFDFYTGSLQNYAIDKNASWADAIVSAYIK